MQLEQRGVATATIITPGFVKAAEAHRRLLKRPDLPYFVVSHPLATLTDAQFVACADEIYEGVAAIVAASLAPAKPDGA